MTGRLKTRLQSSRDYHLMKTTLVRWSIVFIAGYSLAGVVDITPIVSPGCGCHP